MRKIFSTDSLISHLNPSTGKRPLTKRVSPSSVERRRGGYDITDNNARAPNGTGVTLCRVMVKASHSQRGSTNLSMPLPSVPAARLVGHDGPIISVDFTADGKYCLTGGNDRSVRLFNPCRIDPGYNPDAKSEGTVPPALSIQTYTDGHSHPVAALAVDPQSTTLVSTSDKVVVVTDIVSKKIKRRFHGHAGMINAVACSNDAETIFSAAYDGTVRIYDGRSRNTDPIQILTEAKDSVSSVLVEQAQNHAEILTAGIDGVLRTYDLRMGEVRCDDVGDPITGIAATRDGLCLAVTCLDGTIRLVQRSSGELLHKYAGGHTAGNYALGISLTSDDSYIVSGSEDGAVALYDIVEGNVVRTLQGHAKPTCAVAAHPMRDLSSVLVSVGYDGKAIVWSSRSHAAEFER